MLSDFYRLDSQAVLDAVESSLGDIYPSVRATGRTLALNSLENRVYEIELDNSVSVVAKFYRPKRWSEEQIAEEHDFCIELEDYEVPVVSPYDLKTTEFALETSSPSLKKTDKEIFFAVYPKVRGRLNDELSRKDLETLGRYIGRIHNLGENWENSSRITLSAESYGWAPLQSLRDSEFLKGGFLDRYQQVVDRFLKNIEPRMNAADKIAVHGDCHLGNVLWFGESPSLLDFDDMLIAPGVQDIWMIVTERGREAEEKIDWLLSAYEQMREFDRSSLGLIEALRGLRIIHYSAWIAKRWEDPSFPRAFPSFGSEEYWSKEIEALMEISELCSSI